jgi:hypothetical protein
VKSFLYAPRERGLKVAARSEIAYHPVCPARAGVGFLMAGIVMEVVGRFFFITYPDAVSDAGSMGGMFDLFSLLVVIGVFFTTSVMIINTSVNLIHLVPDTVLSWIAPGTQSAGAGSGMNGEFANSAAGVAGYGGSIAKQSLANATNARNGRQQTAQSKAAKEDADKKHQEMLDSFAGKSRGGVNIK